MFQFPGVRRTGRTRTEDGSLQVRLIVFEARILVVEAVCGRKFLQTKFTVLVFNRGKKNHK